MHLHITISIKTDWSNKPVNKKSFSTEGDNKEAGMVRLWLHKIPSGILGVMKLRATSQGG